MSCQLLTGDQAKAMANALESCGLFAKENVRFIGPEAKTMIIEFLAETKDNIKINKELKFVGVLTGIAHLLNMLSSSEADFAAFGNVDSFSGDVDAVFNNFNREILKNYGQANIASHIFKLKRAWCLIPVLSVSPKCLYSSIVATLEFCHSILTSKKDYNNINNIDIIDNDVSTSKLNELLTGIEDFDNKIKPSILIDKSNKAYKDWSKLKIKKKTIKSFYLIVETKRLIKELYELQKQEQAEAEARAMEQVATNTQVEGLKEALDSTESGRWRTARASAVALVKKEEGGACGGGYARLAGGYQRRQSTEEGGCT